MSAPAAFQASYSDWKLIRTRKVVQIVLEVPVERADEAYSVLGGMPLSGEETWVGVARLKQEAKEVMPDTKSRPHPRTDTAPVLADPPPVTLARAYHPVSPDKRLCQRAAILCNDKQFQAWLKETNAAWNIMNLGTAEQKAAELIRVYCEVKSRRDIVPGTQAAQLFDCMLNDYTAWQACLEDAS